MIPPYDSGGHKYYARDTIAARRPLHWPNGSCAAFAVVVCAEYYELQPPIGTFMPANLPGGFGRGPYPDFRVYSARAYGNRVGIFRILDALSRVGIRPTVALDALTAQYCPQLVEHLLRRGDDIAAHGYSVNRVISAHMSESEERGYIRASLDAIKLACGIRPKGWHGPEYGESAHTPTLLVQQGISYVLDWPNDEQPVRMSTPFGSLISVPMLVDLDDVYAQFHRKLSPARWRQCVEDGLDRIITDGEGSGRLLVLNLHPWLTGHPFRISYLEELLQKVVKRKDIWLTTTGDIANWFSSHDVSVKESRT